MSSSHPLDDVDDDAPSDDRPSNIELDYSEKAFERGKARKQEAHAAPVSSPAPLLVPVPRSSAPRAPVPELREPRTSRSDALWIALTLIGTALLIPSTVQAVEATLGSYAFAPFALVCLAALIGAGLTFARGLNLGANLLHLSGAGLVLQAILTAVVTAAVAVDSRAARAFFKIMPVAAPLASALVIVGLVIRRVGHKPPRRGSTGR